MKDKDKRFLYRLAIYDFKNRNTIAGQFVGFADDILREGITTVLDMDEEMWSKGRDGKDMLVRRYQLRDVAIPAWLPSFYWPDFMNNQGVRAICFALLESPKKGSLPEFKRNLRECFIRWGKLTDKQLSALFKYDEEGRRYFGLTGRKIEI